MSRIASIGRPVLAVCALLVLAACAAPESARVQLAAEPEETSSSAV